MAESSPQPRRKRVERNIYQRSGGTFEVMYRDGAGKQRCRTVPDGGGKLAARRLLAQLLADRSTGGHASPNPRLSFGAAATAWYDDHVLTLRTSTQSAYRANLGILRKRFQTARLDRIGPEDVARLIRELRAEGYAEWTISGTLQVAGQVYKHAERYMGWSGPNPVAQLRSHERAKTSQSAPRVIFTAEQIAEVIAAADEPWRTLFLVAAMTGARVSEIVGLTWANVRVDDLDDGEIRFSHQLGRDGELRPTKTDGSARTIPIPRPLAEALATFRMGRGLNGRETGARAFVFATLSGRAVSQRNVSRALRRAQEKAKRPDGRWTFPELHEVTDRGKPKKPPRGALPSMHAFRHSYATLALVDGESVDEVASLIGHANANVTRSVYVHEVADARRRASRRARVGASYVSAMAAHAATPDATDVQPDPAGAQEQSGTVAR